MIKNLNFTKNKFFYSFSRKWNFDQFKDKPKRHFMIYYKFVEDMHYKRGKILKNLNKL